MHYYPFNIGDYRRQTHHLTLVEHGIYRSLLDTYYLTEEPLCDDIAKLMRSHCVRTDEERKALENVISDFFYLSDDGYRHSTCDEVIGKYKEKSEKASKSAKARWNNANASRSDANASKDNANASNTHSERIANEDETQSECNANGMREACVSDANHKPITNNQYNKDPLVQAQPEPKAKKSKFKFNDDDLKAAHWMYTRVALINPAHPEPNFDNWANTVRLMREINNHTHEEIAALFDFANKDDFWCANILSPAKLRKQWDALSAKMRTSVTRGKPGNGSGVNQIGNNHKAPKGWVNE